MAHNILLENTFYAKNSIILTDIDNLYNHIKKLEKKKKSFLNHIDERELLNLVLQNINSLIENINKSSTNNELFLSEELIKYINKHSISKKTHIDSSSNFNREIRANSTLLKALILLTILMQIDENGVDSANIYLSLNSNSNSLSIQMPNFIDYHPEQESILFGKESHKFDEKSKKFYGLYLFFINIIVDKLYGKVKIYNKNSNKYKIFITIPVEIEDRHENDTIDKNSAVKSLRKKLAIYSRSRYISHKIKDCLDEYNFYIKILTYKKDKNPNFKNYDLVIIDSDLLNKELASSLSKEENIKLLLLKDKESSDSSFTAISDKVLTKPFNKSELSFSVLELFSDEIKNSKLSEDREKNKKVIIADSNLANLKLLEHMISQYNIDVFSTSDGKELIEILEKNGADLIIVDNNLSSMDAYETAKYIRAKKKYNHIPIVIHSSFSLNKQSISNIFHAGFDSYLPKPFTSKDIKSILKRYLTIDEKDKRESSTKEFLALYQDIDTLIEKYAQSNKINNLKSLLVKIKEELNKLEQYDLVSNIDNIINSINLSNTIDKFLVNDFINKFRSYIFSISNS